MAGSKKSHMRGPHHSSSVAHTLQCYVANITITHGTTQKMPHVCKVISVLYCTLRLTPLLTNFAVGRFASNHAYTLLSRYEYFYTAIMILNFISVYWYIARIPSGNKRCFSCSPPLSITLCNRVSIRKYKATGI